MAPNRRRRRNGVPTENICRSSRSHKDEKGEGKTQIWLLDRRGGEAQPLTDVKRDIEGFSWSPDGKKIALQLSGDEETADADKDKKAHKAPKPIVIDRYQFKADIEGYLTDASRSQISIFDVADKKLEALTNDRRYDDQDATWSPDSSKIAFVSAAAAIPIRPASTKSMWSMRRPARRRKKSRRSILRVASIFVGVPTASRSCIWKASS